MFAEVSMGQSLESRVSPAWCGVLQSTQSKDGTVIALGARGNKQQAGFVAVTTEQGKT